ncbi:MAG: PKD domain-containing protein [bacterium]|nr:PKD domain-containing protein [bacterium]
MRAKLGGGCFKHIIYVFLIMISVFIACPVLAGTGEVTIGDTTVIPGGFSVAIKADVCSNPLGCYDFSITYDSSLVTIQDIAGGTAPEFSATPISDTTTFTSGTTAFVAFNTTSMTLPTGVVNVATITFWGDPANAGLQIIVNLLADTNGNIIEPLVADFYGSLPLPGPIIGPAPLTVNFSDSSPGDILTWLWDFGDGNTSTAQNNVPNTYNTPGIYTVSLTVSDTCGSDTETKTGYVTVHSRLVADFTAGDTSGCVPLEVDFSDSSSGDILSWLWEFGDGDTRD